MSVSSAVGHATSDTASVLGRAEARAGQMDQRNSQAPAGAPKESALDGWNRARQGYHQQLQELGVDKPYLPLLIKEPIRAAGHLADGAKGLRAAAGTGVHHGSVDGVLATGGQVIDQVGKDLANLANAEGAVQTFGATVATLTSLEQLISAPLAAVPFPAFPALRVGDYDIGMPHGHAHPPNLIPPAPMIPLPSTGPVVPIPFVSGANKTLINGMPAARCGDLGLSIWCGGYVPLYEVVFGSASVWVEGMRAARMGVDVTNHCIFSARKGPDDKPIGNFLGLAIMGSPNVVIGGMPLPSLTNMALGAALRPLFKTAGRVLKALRKTKAVQSLAEKLTERGRQARAAARELADTIPDMPAFRAGNTVPGMPAFRQATHDLIDIMLRDFPQDVRDLVRRSPTLTEQLRRLQREGWTVRRGPDPSVCRRGQRRIDILAGHPHDEFGAIGHEAGHGIGPPPPYHPGPGLSEAEYVRQDVANSMADEGRAQFNEAKVRDELRQNGTDTRMSGQRSDEYYDVYEDHKNGNLTQQEAEQRMGDLMKDDYTGNTGDKYRDYYTDSAMRKYPNYRP
jgi:uncharacterized Zn-binding protein involved in type VI secretion